MKKQAVETWLALYDVHYPFHHKPTIAATLDFLKKNKVDGFLFGGDQQDNQEISHHTKGKGLYRLPGTYTKNTRGFDTDVLRPIEALLPKGCKRVYLEGNHDFWEKQLVEEHPELQGTIERELLLNLEARGWDFVPCGERFKKGKLSFTHGDTLSGIGNQASVYHAKKAVETYCGSVVYGHMHAPQSYTKVLPHDEKEKWMAYCAPCACEVNPQYLRNRNTAWLNGIVVVEFLSDGCFNVFPCIVSNGTFAYGGRTYGGR